MKVTISLNEGRGETVYTGELSDAPIDVVVPQGVRTSAEDMRGAIALALEPEYATNVSISGAGWILVARKAGA